VARHIHALEEELNSRLFHRSNSGYGLTEVGERLFAGGEALRRSGQFKVGTETGPCRLVSIIDLFLSWISIEPGAIAVENQAEVAA
jgi:DNA-binding transcriptional LysR family regulator